MSDSEYKGRYIVIGPPGTGKTTFLANQTKKIMGRNVTAMGTINPTPVLICSLTKAAAAEIGGRDLNIPKQQVSTLHSHGYRQLGCPKIAEVEYKEWSEYAAAHGKAQWELGECKDLDPDDPDYERRADAQKTEGQDLLEEYQLCRTRMKDRAAWRYTLRSFAKLWEEWKKETGYIDFTDMIERAYEEVDCPPGNPDVIIADEAQDLSRLEYSLLKKWGDKAGALIITGDLRQCQPPGSMILLEGRKWKAIENLDPANDRIVSYDRRGSYIVGLRNQGKRFKKTSKPFNGELIRIRNGMASTFCTPDHRWLVKFSRSAEYSKKCCVYLMRKGENFRIGWCQLFHEVKSRGKNKDPIRVFRFNTRCNIEGASQGWILKILDSRTEASIYGSICAANFGLPTATFRSVPSATHTSRYALDKIFLNIEDQLSKGVKILKEHGLSLWLPMWERYTKGQGLNRAGGTSIMDVRALNLIPKIMEIPFYLGTNKPTWGSFSTSKENYEGNVYSLEVDTHETYITDACFITHNSLYCWRGADPKIFMDPSVPKEHRRVLGQSYRIPKAVQNLADACAQEMSDYSDIEYKPRDVEGFVEYMPGANYRKPEAAIETAMELNAQGKSVMFVVTCSYMLKNIQAFLRREGIPYANPWRYKRGDWNPLRLSGTGTSMHTRVLEFLNMDEDASGPPADDGSGMRPWNALELYHWTHPLKAKNLLIHGAKTKIKNWAEERPEDMITLNDLGEFFESSVFDELFTLFDVSEHGYVRDPKNPRTPDLLKWYEHNLMPKKAKMSEYIFNVAHTNGIKALRERPKFYIGTAHSFKGAEADYVFVFPDLSPSGLREWQGRGENEDEYNGRDAILRTFYVAITRAKEGVFLCNSTNHGCAVKWREFASDFIC